MSTSAERPSAPGTGLLLRTLLAEYEPYRRQWRRHVLRGGNEAVHRGAVAMVIAEYLWDNGEADEADERLPRRLKDPVGRALTGRVISRRTLEWFIQAFGFTESHQTQLWEQMRADREEPSPLHTKAYRPLPTSHYITRALNEHHVIGRDGLPLRHTTIQVIEAIESISYYTYQFDTSAASIEVARGGRAGRVHPLGDGLFAVDIHFARELTPGESTTLEYHTVFRYDDAPPTVFRRGISRRVGLVALEVQFHPDRLPAEVGYARWEGLEDDPVSVEPVVLRPDHSVHRALTDVEATVVGFTWRW